MTRATSRPNMAKKLYRIMNETHDLVYNATDAAGLHPEIKRNLERQCSETMLRFQVHLLKLYDMSVEEYTRIINK